MQHLMLLLLCLFALSSAFQASTSSLPSLPRSQTGFTLRHRKRAPFSLFSSTDIIESTETTSVYFDISIANTSIGRLVFHLVPSNHPNHLPVHTSNFLSLVSSSRIGIDPKATYKRCEFQYAPSSVEDGSMRYRWGHVCDGPNVQVKEEEVQDANRSLIRCKQSCVGGTYYGMSYEDVLQMIEESITCGTATEREAVLLTVPTTLSTKFSVVRVSESPREWGERLLLNTVVIGYLDCESLDVLKTMARQRIGVPKIVDCGVV